MSSPLLSVRNLTVEFTSDDGIVQAVTDLNYDLFPGETLAILGESGSGKSVGAQAVMGLTPIPPGRIVSGSVLLENHELVGASARDLQRVRGADIAMIFQDPLTSLNPVFPVGWQIAESLRLRDVSRSDAFNKAVELMERVGIPNAKRRARQFPHQFSGGMRQRLMIAMALALDPKVLIADEPTTALDVTVQAQIMELLQELQDELGMAMVLITHDLGVVASVSDRVLVMYGGRVVETGRADEFYARPGHPYSQGLLDSVPRLRAETGRLIPIPGLPPSVIHLPSGCSFHPRCPYADESCATTRPELEPFAEVAASITQREVACLKTEEIHGSVA